MARVAYVMDGIMGKVGLSGKAFLPMVLGFGCTVPAVMASRTLENEEDRKKTILLTPFMSCSARLPIYVLFASVFFGKFAMIVAFSLYALGLIVAILLALIIGKVWKTDTKVPLLIELPDYKVPNPRTIRIYVWEKVKDYLTKAGTTIFVASIVIWFILNYNFQGMTSDVTTSFGAMIGKVLAPVLVPAGTGRMADRGGPDLRTFCERSGNFQLLRTLRREQHQFTGRNGNSFRRSGSHWFRTAERLCTDGVLSAVYSLCGNSCHHQEGDPFYVLDTENGGIPAASGLCGGCAGIPDRKSFISKQKENKHGYSACGSKRKIYSYKPWQSTAFGLTAGNSPRGSHLREYTINQEKDQILKDIYTGPQRFCVFPVISGTFLM